MKKRRSHPVPQISSSEWEIMVLLWEEAPLRARDILDRLPEDRNWSPKTVNTFLTRLHDKGAVSVEKVGRLHHYSAAVGKDACVAKESSAFVQKYFGGEAAPMLLHFLKHESLSKDDLNRLRNILNEEEEA